MSVNGERGRGEFSVSFIVRERYRFYIYRFYVDLVIEDI